MSERDGLIVETAKAEHRRLKDAVIRAAKLWRTSKAERLACQMLNDAVSDLFTFEQRYKGLLDLSGKTNKTDNPKPITRENEQ